jgi:Protein of unknown function (DUF2721)
MQPSIAQIIVQMVSPAVMVSGCGLMLLTLGNKYARVVDRLRAFGAEYRALKKLGPDAAVVDRQRIQVLETHFPDVFRRGQLLRNAVLFFYTAIMFFVGCSFTIPLGVSWLPLVSFCLGMASVLIGTVFAWHETLLSFRLIRLEAPDSPGS